MDYNTYTQKVIGISLDDSPNAEVNVDKNSNTSIIGINLDDIPNPELNIDEDLNTSIIEISIDRTGPQGFSAYETAVAQGFIGNKEDWLKSLLPIKGVDYFTPVEQSEMVDEIINEIGPPDSAFSYSQGTPSDIWIITHNLHKYPSVTIVDSAGSVVTGDIKYLTEDELMITFAGRFSGNAYLN